MTSKKSAPKASKNKLAIKGEAIAVKAGAALAGEPAHNSRYADGSISPKCPRTAKPNSGICPNT